MKHVVVALETLDVTPSSVIVQIGICHIGKVDGKWSFSSSRLDVDIEQPGRSIGADTLRWWTTGAGHDAPFIGTTPLRIALSHVAEQLRGADCVWFNGPAFDFSILEHAFKQVGLEFPAWDRDLKNESPHDAEAGAVFKAKQIAYFLDKISAKTEGE